MFIVRPAVSISPRPPEVSHRHFLRVADVGGEVRRLVAARRVADVQPVDRQARLDAAAAVDREDREHRPGVDVVDVGLQPGNRAQQVAVAANARQAPHRLVVERDLTLRALRVDDRRLAGDGDRLLHAADAHVGVHGDDRRAADDAAPSRFTVAKPASVNVTVYVPGRRSSIRYRPAPSVTVLRTFSISAGLAASTVTPGSTAPEASLTMPAMVACAQAGMSHRQTGRNEEHLSNCTHRWSFPHVRVSLILNTISYSAMMFLYRTDAFTLALRNCQVSVVWRRNVGGETRSQARISAWREKVGRAVRVCGTQSARPAGRIINPGVHQAGRLAEWVPGF